MYYILRNNRQFGPYDATTMLSFVDSGKILLCDVAQAVGSSQTTTVRDVLKSAHLKPHIVKGGPLLGQIKKIGAELIFPPSMFNRKSWKGDNRLLLLSIVGLTPSVLMLLPIGGFLVFYFVALYFSAIWALFFYYFFKTSQVNARTTLMVFFLTQIFVFLIWDVLGLPSLNPFYQFVDASFPLDAIGYIFGVGLTEELAKAIPLFIISRRAKGPLVPQTLVYYGLMSGIAFGVYEGVEYQMTVNIELDYTSAFFMNIARLTSLPFLHAMWCGIAGYFISFAVIYPRYRHSLYFLAIAIPAVLHGLYDTFCQSMLGMFIAVPIMAVGVVLLITYLKQGVNLQSKLRA